VIRTVLCAVLCALTVVVSLATSAVQSGNRDRAIALDGIKRECDMLEAVNGDRCQRILAEDWRPIPPPVQAPAPAPPEASPQAWPTDKSRKSPPAPARTPLLASSPRRSNP
jgi:hypothetical protein